MTTFGETYELGKTRLENANIADAKLDAQALLLFLMNEDKTFLFMHKNDGIDEYHANAYFNLIDRRAAGEPLQYIVGTQEFMGLEFEVNESVLIPRQDTETLVETAIEKAGEKKKNLRVLDLCCGSGAIAVSMAHFLPKAKITASEKSAEALEIAKKNAAKNGVADRIRFLHADLFSVYKKKNPVRMKDTFDMIVSNPPYIPTDAIATLQPEIRDHEPLMALDGGADGLSFYKLIAQQAHRYLREDGYLLLEIGADQAGHVITLLEEGDIYMDIAVYKDLAGHDRVIFCRKW